MHILQKALLVVLRALILPRAVLAVENAALRQQLAVYLRTAKLLLMVLKSRDYLAKSASQHHPTILAA